MGKSYTVLFEWVSAPVIKQTPIFLTFLMLVGSWIYATLTTLFGGNTDDIMYSGNVCLFLAGRLALWGLMAYVLAAIALIINKKWFLTLCYVFLFSIYVINYFSAANFGISISPTMLTLILETNQRETLEFFSTYLLSDESIKVYAKVFLWVTATLFMEFVHKRYLMSYPPPPVC